MSSPYTRKYLASPTKEEIVYYRRVANMQHKLRAIVRELFGSYEMILHVAQKNKLIVKDKIFSVFGEEFSHCCYQAGDSSKLDQLPSMIERVFNDIILHGKGNNHLCCRIRNIANKIDQPTRSLYKEAIRDEANLIIASGSSVLQKLEESKSKNIKDHYTPAKLKKNNMIVVQVPPPKKSKRYPERHLDIFVNPVSNVPWSDGPRRQPIYGILKIKVRKTDIVIYESNDDKEYPRSNLDSKRSQNQNGLGSIDNRHKPVPIEKYIAIDCGVSESFIDKNGKTYGEGLGLLLAQYDDLDVLASRQRNAGMLKKSYETRSRMSKIKQKIRDHTYKAIHELLCFGLPICEDLRFGFSGKKYHRKLRMWMRSLILDAIRDSLSRRTNIKFKDWKRIFIVPSCWTSQECPNCHYVDSKNRNGNNFCCKSCDYRGHADQIAAINIESRFYDEEIMNIWRSKVKNKCKIIRSIIDRRHVEQKTLNNSEEAMV